MALFQERWSFGGAAPELDRVSRSLQERIGAEAIVHEATREADGRERPARLEVPGVCKGYDFDLFVEEGGITVESGTPPHPYLLPQLRAALQALGGTRGRPGSGASPDERFLRPWAELGWKSRLLLGRISLWMFWKWA
jgi:hypothetical protein